MQQPVRAILVCAYIERARIVLAVGYHKFVHTFAAKPYICCFEIQEANAQFMPGDLFGIEWILPYLLLFFWTSDFRVDYPV